MSKNELNQMDQLQAENAALRAERDDALALLEQENKRRRELGDENHQLAIRLHAAQATTRAREHELEKLRADNARQRAEIARMQADHSERDLEKATPSRLPTIGPEEC